MKIPSLPTNPKILIARGDAMGDVILSTTLIKPLKKKFPNCKIYYLVKKEYFSLLDQIPEIEGLIDDSMPYDTQDQSLTQIYSLGKELRAHNFDIFIGLWEKFRYALTSKIANIPIRIGHGIGLTNKLLYTHYQKTDPLEYTKHQAEWNLSLLQLLNIHSPEEPCYIQISDTAIKKNDLIYPALKSKYCCICLDAKTDQKKITTEQYTSVIKYLTTEKKISVVLIGQEKKSDNPEKIINNIKEHSFPIINLVGKLNLVETAAVISKSILYFGPDTGLAHLAAAFNKSAIIYFLNKTQNPMRWGPWQTPHIILKSAPNCIEPCDSITCQKSTCRNLNEKELNKSFNIFLPKKSDINKKEPIHSSDENLYRLKKGLNIGIIGEIDPKTWETLHNNNWQIFSLEKNISIRKLARLIIKNNINLLLLFRNPYKIKYWLAQKIASNSMHFYTKIEKANNLNEFNAIINKLKT
jgi:ADP-heptose:LPS heptosyltransferase